MERPLQLGAAVTGAAGDGSFLSGYGLPLGEAFQLRDDVLGVFGDPGGDRQARGRGHPGGQADPAAGAGPGRWPVPRSSGSLETIPGNPAATDADIADVRTALAGCGALDAVERRIASLAGQARAALEAEAGRPGDARAALLQLAGLATRRGR